MMISAGGKIGGFGAGLVGRRDRIRTCDLLLPKQASIPKKFSRKSFYLPVITKQHSRMMGQFMTLIPAHVCSRMQTKAGTGGGKIGGLPRVKIPSFWTAISLSRTALNTILSNFTFLKSPVSTSPESGGKMARINIEDSLYRDHRFMSLVVSLRSVDMALGALVRAWALAQQWYLKDDGLIPKDEWIKQALAAEIIACGLATEENARIRVAGADEQFSWLKQRVEAGRRGGIAKSRQNNKNSSEELILRNGARAVLARAVREGRVSKPSHCQDCGQGDRVIEGHHSDYSKPLEVDWLCKRCHTEVHRGLRQAVASGSLATGISRQPEANPPYSYTGNAQSKPRAPRKRSGADASNVASAPLPSPVGHFVKGYCDRFLVAYGTYPEITGKEAGIAKRVSKELSLEKIDLYLDAYFQMPDAWLKKIKHPVTAFETKLTEITVFANTGNFTTQKQTQQGDAMTTNLALLKKAQGGGK